MTEQPSLKQRALEILLEMQREDREERERVNVAERLALSRAEQKQSRARRLLGVEDPDQEGDK